MKKLITILILLPLFSFSQIDDKVLHNYAGAGASIIGGYAIYKITNKPALGYAGGFALGVLAGIVKERYDKSQGREFSNLDLQATAWGSAIGTVVLIIPIKHNRKKKYKQLNK